MLCQTSLLDNSCRWQKRSIKRVQMLTYTHYTLLLLYFIQYLSVHNPLTNKDLETDRVLRKKQTFNNRTLCLHKDSRTTNFFLPPLQVSLKNREPQSYCAAPIMLLKAGGRVCSILEGLPWHLSNKPLLWREEDKERRGTYNGNVSSG